MKYDLTIKDDRRKFIHRANVLLQSQRSLVELSDESGRTLNQNSYLHVLCRILAAETGVTENYAKQVYLKQLACPDIFISVTKDELAGKAISITRSTADLSIPEMRKVITEFRDWAAGNGYYLPEASVNDDGTLTFTSENDKKAFHKALIETSTN